MNRKYQKYDIPLDIVAIALSGTEEGYAQLLNFYDGYISKLCTMDVTDGACLSAYSYVDEDLKQLMRIGIVKAAQEFARKVYSPSN